MIPRDTQRRYPKRRPKRKFRTLGVSPRTRSGGRCRFALVRRRRTWAGEWGLVRISRRFWLQRLNRYSKNWRPR